MYVFKFTMWSRYAMEIKYLAVLTDSPRESLSANQMNLIRRTARMNPNRHFVEGCENSLSGGNNYEFEVF